MWNPFTGPWTGSSSLWFVGLLVAIIIGVIATITSKLRTRKRRD